MDTSSLERIRTLIHAVGDQSSPLTVHHDALVMLGNFHAHKTRMGVPSVDPVVSLLLAQLLLLSTGYADAVLLCPIRDRAMFRTCATTLKALGDGATLPEEKESRIACTYPEDDRDEHANRPSTYNFRVGGSN